MASLVRSGGFRDDIDAAAVFIEQHFAGLQGKQCPIAANAYVLARHKFAAALAHDDAARGHEFAAKCFHAQTLADAVTPVAYAALTFFMCHKLENLRVGED